MPRSRAAQTASRGKGRAQDLERRLQEAHEQYARRIRTLEARAIAAEAAAAAAAQGHHTAATEAAAADSGGDGHGGVSGWVQAGWDAVTPEGDEGGRGDEGSWSDQALPRHLSSEMRQQLALRNKQVAELQQQLRVAERQVRQLQRGQQHQAQPHCQQRSGAAAEGALVEVCEAPPAPQQLQQHPQQPAAEQHLRMELAAAQGALALLQRSHAELLQRTVELGATQQCAVAEAQEAAARREADRWLERVSGLEQVRRWCA